MKWVARYRGIIVEVIYLLFIVLLTYAGLTKFLEGHRFYDNLRNSPIIGGETLASLASWMVPLAELAVALLLVKSRTRLIGLYGALGLMLLFTGYTVAIVFIAPYRPCSCGGVISLLSWEQHLVLNILFLLLAILGIALSLKEQKIIDAHGELLK
ncbi:hypothetical protein C21_00394 [Arenibacter sp. NBRC 103722]|uniref:MauE/DoxX family redox-associated membrane protein n=1 Tax=Arenibacter sp. NBRC 103722 TaxID=1113929 RepID=UPI00085379E6|nr:MauE/DoxX family redox-associated membrane protein [Arenibacter sp. NBRC 103722]GBF18237.1 hypothetical protein C21_00394 [Arenibacter sp. NBRC 103722]